MKATAYKKYIEKLYYLHLELSAQKSISDYRYNHWVRITNEFNRINGIDMQYRTLKLSY